MPVNSILAVGSIAIDWLELPDGREGEVLGGSVTYFLLAASGFAPVHVVGIVGTDFPDEGMKLLRKYAANLDDLQVVPGKTFRWGGQYHGDWESRTTLYTELGVFESFQPTLSRANRKCGVIFLGNIQPSLQLDILEQAENSQRVVVCDTMNLWIKTTRDDLLKVLRLTDILLINEEEAFLLTGVSGPERAANAIREMGPSQVVVKRGSKGSLLVKESGEVKIGAYPLKVVGDPTGAGDSFAGGFSGALARGECVEDALIAASAVASFCVEEFGIEGLKNMNEKELNHRMDFIRKNQE